MVGDCAKCWTYSCRSDSEGRQRTNFVGLVLQIYRRNCYAAGDVVILALGRGGWAKVFLGGAGGGTPVGHARSSGGASCGIDG